MWGNIVHIVHIVQIVNIVNIVHIVHIVHIMQIGFTWVHLGSLVLILDTWDKMGPFGGSGTDTHTYIHTYIHTYTHLNIFPMSRDPIGYNN